MIFNVPSDLSHSMILWMLQKGADDAQVILGGNGKEMFLSLLV